ncbi:MAG: hypothetical protein O2887_08780 [Bacteroidetes bacterium]|nr:hypothetical protein [Bacteroidota bacterium]MDA1120569.1 hypothetical protein [Bacteroidota bacterium]
MVQIIPDLKFLDARDLIETDSNYQDATVNWEATSKKIRVLLFDEIDSNVVITQGFIGADQEGNSTSLGREGSEIQKL